MTGRANEPLLYTISDTARLLGVSRDYVYKLMRDGELEIVRLGAKPFITRASIDAALARNRVS